VFLIVMLVALTALAWAMLAVPYRLGLAITRHWHGRSDANPRTAPLASQTPTRLTHLDGRSER